MSLLSKYKLTLIGIVVGAIGGYAYYHFEGCTTGCPITSHPLNSMLYGALTGILLFTSFKKESSKNKNHAVKKEKNSD